MATRFGADDLYMSVPFLARMGKLTGDPTYFDFAIEQVEHFNHYLFDPATGLWHQLLDKNDSYLESSVTAMFTYTVAKAVNEGWINPGYMSIARNGWKGLESKVTPEGELEDVCMGTGIEDDIRFYYTRPAPLNDTHGLGAFLLAGAEMVHGENARVARSENVVVK